MRGLPSNLLKNVKWQKSEVLSFRLWESITLKGFPSGSAVKESTCNAGDPGLIPGSGRSPGEGNGYPLQYSGWEIPWTEEPGGREGGGYSPRGSRVGHDLGMKQQ